MALIDEAADTEALSRTAQKSERNKDEISKMWDLIRSDLNGRGLFSRLILNWRESAISAIADLVYADGTNSNEIIRLQGEVKRYLQTVEMIQQYKEGAIANDANSAYSPEEEEVLATLRNTAPDDSA